MKMQYGKKRNAVAPVLATLLMIAVAVAMSVILFMWSQGFLSNTSGAVGGQQGAQNQAAQSSISIESATFVTGTAHPAITIIVRNVGAVSVSIGSITAIGSSSNGATDFTGSVLATYPAASTATVTASDATTWTISPASSASSAVLLSKGTSLAITLTGPASGDTTTQISSGDTINIKVTSTVGTFATSQYTVP